MYERYYALDPNGDNYLGHHGILGQKHGVRNGPPYPLGSGKGSHRTAAQVALNGAKRGMSAVAKYGGKAVNSFNTIKAKKQAEVDAKNDYAKKAKEHRKQMKKGYHELTDDELDQRIKRLQKEENYKRLVNSVYPDEQKKQGLGKKVIGGIFDGTTKSLTDSVSKALGKSIEKKVDELINGEEYVPDFWVMDNWIKATPAERKKMAEQAKTVGPGTMAGIKNMQDHITKSLAEAAATTPSPASVEHETRGITTCDESWSELIGYMPTEAYASYCADIASSPEYRAGSKIVEFSSYKDRFK